MDFGPCVYQLPFLLPGDLRRQYEFRAHFPCSNRQTIFSLTDEDFEEGILIPINHEDDWVAAISIPLENYQTLRIGRCSPVLEKLLTRIADRQCE